MRSHASTREMGDSLSSIENLLLMIGGNHLKKRNDFPQLRGENRNRVMIFPTQNELRVIWHGDGKCHDFANSETVDVKDATPNLARGRTYMQRS